MKNPIFSNASGLADYAAYCRWAEERIDKLEGECFALASWQCPELDGQTGLVAADNGSQYCARERRIAELEAELWEAKQLVVEQNATIISLQQNKLKEGE